MRKPIIGIVGNVMTKKTGVAHEVQQSYVYEDYVIAVVKAGGIPIILPIVDDLKLVCQQIESCDGIIMTGGYDVHPKFYSENQHQHKNLEIVSSRVDLHQMELARLAVEKNIPTLGICRGMQLINVVNGGSLYQDVSEISGEILKHRAADLSNIVEHQITIESDSILNGILGESVIVNSYHHQSVNRIGDGLRVTACAPDGVIEAVEMINKKFVVGVQWHPEKMVAVGGEMLGIFETLIEKAHKNTSSD